MRILLVNTYYYPEIYGGAEISVKKLAEQLAKSGYEVYVLCTGEENVRDIINGVNIIRFKSRTCCRACDAGNQNKVIKLRHRLEEVYNFRNCQIIDTIIREFKPDVIHTNGLYDISPSIWSMAKKNRIRVVHTLRDYYLICPRSTLVHKSSHKQCNKEKFTCTMYRRFNQMMTRNVDVVTAPSNFTLNLICRNKLFVKADKIKIFNAIDFNIADVQNMRGIRENRNRDSLRFVFLGSLEKTKGLQWLIESFQQIKRQNCELYIAGKGSLENFVKQLEEIDSRIHFCGLCSEQQVNQLLVESDVLVCPSLWNEPFGRVVIDAYKQCMPVIANSMGALPEIVLDGKTGLLVNSSNKESLRLAMEKFIDDRINQKIMYKNIVDLIDEFSINRQVERFIKVYEN